MFSFHQQLQHKLKDDDSEVEEWYKGEITNIDSHTDTITVHYTGYEDDFSWSKNELVKDLKTKELILL